MNGISPEKSIFSAVDVGGRENFGFPTEGMATEAVLCRLSLSHLMSHLIGISMDVSDSSA